MEEFLGHEEYLLGTEEGTISARDFLDALQWKAVDIHPELKVSEQVLKNACPTGEYPVFVHPFEGSPGYQGLRDLEFLAMNQTLDPGQPANVFVQYLSNHWFCKCPKAVRSTNKGYTTTFKVTF